VPQPRLSKKGHAKSPSVTSGDRRLLFSGSLRKIVYCFTIDEILKGRGRGLAGQGGLTD